MQLVTGAAAYAYMTLLVAILHVHAHNSTCRQTFLDGTWMAGSDLEKRIWQLL